MHEFRSGGGGELTLDDLVPDLGNRRPDDDGVGVVGRRQSAARPDEESI